MAFELAEVEGGERETPPSLGDTIRVEIDGLWYLADVIGIQDGIGMAEVHEHEGELFEFSWIGWNYDPRVKY